MKLNFSAHPIKIGFQDTCRELSSPPANSCWGTFLALLVLCTPAKVTAHIGWGSRMCSAQPPSHSQSGRIYSRRCSMMLSMVGLKRAFMASGLILSMPCEDHFTKSTLWECHRDKCVKAGLSPGPPTGSLDPGRHSLGAQRRKCPICPDQNTNTVSTKNGTSSVSLLCGCSRRRNPG